MKTVRIVLLTFLLIICATLAFASCGGNNDNETTEAKLVRASGFTIEGTALSLTLPNGTASYSFADKIEVNSGATWQISSDPNGMGYSLTKSVELHDGNNDFYLFVISADGKTVNRYTVSIWCEADWYVVEDGVIIGVTPSFKKYATTAQIPSEVNGTTIIGIGDNAFHNCSGLTSVVIPDSITSIGDRAFYQCSELTSVVWNATKCTSAGSGSAPIFSGCSNLTTVTIGENVETIPADAFYNCSGLTSVVWNAINCTSAGSYSHPIFSGCAKLATVMIGENVETIPAYAFSGCKGLTSVTIPDSVTSIGYNAFYGCTNLQYNTYDNGLYLGNESNPYLSLIKANDTSITSCTIHEDTKIIGSAFSNCSGLTSVTIPDSVTSIGDSAFYGCSGLTSVTIPDSITSIGNEAFRGCSGLTSVVWNATNCTSAGSSRYPIFSGCSNLTSVTFGENVKTIPAYAFSGCKGLTSVTIPDSVTSIGNYAFSGCSNLQYTAYDNGLYLGNSSNPYVVLTKASDKSITSCSIYNNTRIIYESAFHECRGLTTLCIPDSVTSIGNSAFRDCSGLTSITIPDSVTSIGNSAFLGCSGLTSVKIGNGVTSIGNSAFYGCSGLTSVTIPDSVTSIGDFAFFGCSGLTSVAIGNGVTSIGNSAFCGCSGLTSVTIPDSVTSIGREVFSGCSGLTSITIPDSVTSIGDYAFCGCSGLTLVTFVGTKAQWNAISKGSDWNYSTGNYTVHCTDGDIAK